MIREIELGKWPKVVQTVTKGFNAFFASLGYILPPKKVIPQEMSESHFFGG